MPASFQQADGLAFPKNRHPRLAALSLQVLRRGGAADITDPERWIIYLPNIMSDASICVA